MSFIHCGIHPDLFYLCALGGMFINIDGESWGYLDCNNKALVSSSPCRRFQFIATNISQNFAEFGGGGVYVTAPESIYAKCSFLKGEDTSRQTLKETILNTMSAETVDFQSEKFVTDNLGCVQLDGNDVGKDGFGKIAATKAVALTIVYPEEPIANHTSNTNLAGANGIQVGILDTFEQLVKGGNPDAGRWKIVRFEALLYVLSPFYTCPLRDLKRKHLKNVPFCKCNDSKVEA